MMIGWYGYAARYRRARAGPSTLRELVFQSESLSVDDLLAVYRIDEKLVAPAPQNIGIVDDVLTNGTHFRAMKRILQNHFPGVPVVGFFYQKNSTRHFMREVNRLGVTGVIDAGGGFQNYPEDYQIIEELHRDGQLTVRIAYNLFTQKPKQELQDFEGWAKQVRPGQGDDIYRNNGAIALQTMRISSSNVRKCRRRWRPSSSR
jgi:predicted amidohydrolase YtcJ